MPPATVATIACLALVAVAGMAVWVASQRRRTDELARSLTTRKWEIVTLRAELGAIRRQVQGIGGDRTAGAPGWADPEPDPRVSTGRSRTPAGSSPSPTAWRRDRARGASSRPRRRRPF